MVNPTYIHDSLAKTNYSIVETLYRSTTWKIIQLAQWKVNRNFRSAVIRSLIPSFCEFRTTQTHHWHHWKYKWRSGINSEWSHIKIALNALSSEGMDYKETFLDSVTWRQYILADGRMGVRNRHESMYTRLIILCSQRTKKLLDRAYIVEHQTSINL